MRDPRVDRLARVIVEYSTGVQPGELVVIRSDPTGLPLVEALFERVLAAGGHPVWSATSEDLLEVLYRDGSESQAAFLSPLDMHEIEEANVRIVLWAETNTRRFTGVDPSKQSARSAGRRPYMKRFLEREGAGDLRWCGTLHPTQASAQDAEMSLREYEDFVYGAGMLGLPDPVSAWRALGERQSRICEWLDGRKELRFTAPPSDGHDGTDLRVSVDGSRWINCAGRSNFPDGEVFAGPQGVEGHVNYTFPAVYGGREVEGVRLVFREGRAVDAVARKNEGFLHAMLDQDAGARVMGEIAIGTNYEITRFTRNTLFDEKIGGTFHAAVGAGYAESGNANESGLHWDMVCDLRGGGEIAADGEVFHRAGRFVKSGLF